MVRPFCEDIGVEQAIRAVFGSKCSRTQEARKYSKKHWAMKQLCAFLVLPLNGKAFQLCTLTIFSSRDLVSLSIIWGGGLGQGCRIWSCKLKFTMQKIMEQSRGSQHGSNPHLSLYHSKTLLVNYQNIGISDILQNLEGKRSSSHLYLFSLLTRGLGRNK